MDQPGDSGRMRPVTTLTISRILHAGYLFASAGTRVLFDPIFENPFSRNAHAFPAVHFDREAIRRQTFDAVFISHYHDDHCSFESLDLIERSTPIYLYCIHDEMFDLLRRLGFKNVRRLYLDHAVEVGPMTITPWRAFDADVDAVFSIRVGAINVLNVVDALIDDDVVERLRAVAPWDVVLWPFQTMRELDVIQPAFANPAEPSVPPEFIDQLTRLNPRVVVPSSCQFRFEAWSWLNHAYFPISYARFASEVERALPGARATRLDPGRGLVIDQDGAEAAKPLTWVSVVDASPVDYTFDPSRPAPPTAEIARHFPALTARERARVDHYCARELPERFARLDASAAPYFTTARHWRLSVYDHEGLRVDHHYRVHVGTGLEVTADGNACEWTTEIAAARMYGALAHGEALTSLYLRVHDGPYAPSVREGLSDVDVLEDPLIRDLYTGVFAAYQREQLARLGARFGRL